MTVISANIDGGTPTGGETSLSGELGDLLNIVSNQLQDEFGLTWPPSKMIPYIDVCFLEIVNLKPEAYTYLTTMLLTTGARQSLPTGSIGMIEPLCNMGTTGLVVGDTVTALEKNAMDHVLPGWMSYTGASAVSFVVKDDRDPLIFYVFPPQSSVPGYLRALLSKPPDEVTVDSTDFPLAPSYKPAFIDYMIFRALSEETTIPNAQNKAQIFWNKFLQDLGFKTIIEKKTAEKGR